MQDQMKKIEMHSLKKNDFKECKTTIWRAEKLNVAQTVIKIGQSQLTMQAVLLGGSIF